MDALNKNKILKIFPTSVDLFEAAVVDFIRCADAAVAAQGVFTVVLSGGNTAKFFFDALVASERRQRRIPWRRIKFFFGDERYVPADEAESNYFSAKECLFSKVAVLAENIYRMPTEFDDPKMGAKKYAETIRRVFHLDNGELPKFDLVYLGLGEDGHTASLMPGSEIVKNYAENTVLDENDPLVTALWAPQQQMYRITLTPGAINHSAGISFLVTGINKASAVQHTLEGPWQPQQYPAQLIHCANENLIWYLDQQAAGNIGRKF